MISRVLPQAVMKASFWPWSILVSCLTIAAPVWAAEESAGAARADRRWIPGGSIFTSGHVEDRAARMSSDASVDKPDQSRGLPWSVGITADLATPVLFDLPGRPRFFVRADVGYTADVDDPVSSQGSPGAAPFEPDVAVPSVEGIENVGSSVRVEARPLLFSGGVGSVFQFDAFDRGFRLRPSLEWMYRRDTMRTVLGGGETESTTSNLCTPCRTLFIESQTEKGFHGLGPGIELEADVGRMRDFQVGFYGFFRAYYMIGDRKANLAATGQWERSDGQPTSRADTVFRTQYEREPWDYRFGVGIRVLWSPED